MTTQQDYGLAIGYEAGFESQGTSCIAIGQNAGKFNQMRDSISIGSFAGRNIQADEAIAIGYAAGYSTQGPNCIAIGGGAGADNQQEFSIAIGKFAGYTNQGTGSIAIGKFAGVTNQAARSIIIYANDDTSALENTVAGSCKIAPIRSAPSSNDYNVLLYNNNTKEVVRSTGTTSAGKTFIIDHPDDKNKYLVHACLEGPESGVYYRGKSEITNNKYVIVDLPKYVKNLCVEFTIQITQIFNGKHIQLACSEVENNQFIVYGENTKFYYLVQGRRGYINVEPLKSEVNVRGDGPYKYIA